MAGPLKLVYTFYGNGSVRLYQLDPETILAVQVGNLPVIIQSGEVRQLETKD